MSCCVWDGRGAEGSMARAKIKQQRKPLRRRVRRRGATRSARSVPAGALPVFAHDMRTSLTGILALGELLARANPAGRVRAQLHCIVRDSGIGLTRAEIKRLFRPFAQASANIARRYGGAGLGLSVVKILAKRMGGNLTVASTPGRGSTFHFSAMMPIGPAEAQERVPLRQSALPARRRKILLAE